MTAIFVSRSQELRHWLGNFQCGLEITYGLCLSGKTKECLETNPTFRAVPKMTDTPVFQMVKGKFVATPNAGHSEHGTRI